MNTYFSALVFSISIGFFISGCYFQSPQKDQTEEQYDQDEKEAQRWVQLTQAQQTMIDLKLDKIEKRKLQTSFKVTGKITLSPQDKAEASLFVGGNVSRILVKEGDWVKKGQSLALFQHPDFIELQQAYQKAESSLEFLEQEFHRKKALYDNGISSGKDFQRAQSDYASAKVDVQALRAQLQLLGIRPNKVLQGNIQTTIALTAPISGYVNAIHINTGQYASPQQSLFEINNTSGVYALFQVYERDLSKIKIGQEVLFNTESDPQQLYRAKVSSIGKSMNDQTKAVSVYAKIENPEATLLPDLYITGRIQTNREGPSVSTLPTEAIVEEGGQNYVFVYDPSSSKNRDKDSIKTFEMIAILTGESSSDYTEIKLKDSSLINRQIVVNGAYHVNAERTKDSHLHED